MAPVTLETARAARDEARRLRLVTSELRSSARANYRIARARREKAEEAAARSRRGLATAAPSPWSELVWQRDDEELARALVPVD